MIINNISNLRKERNITQGELANDLNVSRQTIIALENNSNNSSISLGLAFKISNYFNLPIEEIFEEKDMNLFNRKANTIAEIQNLYGKNTILIKNNIVYRCGTNETEKGPKCLLNYELPYYGKMKLFVVLNDKVYSLINTEEKIDKYYTKYIVGNEANIDPSCIDFDKTPWNDKKKTNLR